MKKILLLYVKGILFGVIGSLVGIIPNAILKTLLIDTFIGDFCFDYTFFTIEQGINIGISPCGIMPAPMSIMGLLVTLMAIILGGALFGLVFVVISRKTAEKRGHDVSNGNWKGSFWWSFIGGVLFDLFFMFTIIFPGY